MNSLAPLHISDIKIVAAVNDEETLDQCLAASPDILSGVIPLRTYRGFSSAGKAFNKALGDAMDDQHNIRRTRVVVIAHQDVFLPVGFASHLVVTLNALSERVPHWGVAGCIGITAEGNVRGRTWASSMKKIVGNQFQLPAQIVSLDELILVVNMDSADSAFPRFDPELPSFHLYGTDIVQTAISRGLTSYAIDLPVIHHSRPIVSLGRGYWAAYRFCQKKWRQSLPIPTLMGGLFASILPMMKQDILYRLRNRGARVRRRPEGNPADIATSIEFESVSVGDNSFGGHE